MINISKNGSYVIFVFLAIVLFLILSLNKLNCPKNNSTQQDNTNTNIETLNLSEDDLSFEKEVFGQGHVHEKCKKKIDQRIKDLKGVMLSKTPHKEGNIIVSITSFPPRKNFVKYAIYSLMIQRLKANRIILWLSQDEFKNKEADLDPLLLKLKENGLEIRFVEGNIRSHKKYFYAFKEFPDDMIVLADDDYYFKNTHIQKLYDKFSEVDSKYIVCGHSLSVEISEKNKCSTKDSVLNVAKIGQIVVISNGSILKPSMLDKEVLNKEKFMDILPTCDDTWLSIMAAKKGTKILNIDLKSSAEDPYLSAKEVCVGIDPEPGVDKQALWKINQKLDTYGKISRIMESYGLLERFCLEG